MVYNKKAITFALPIKKGYKNKSYKFFESLEITATKQGKISTNINLEFDVNFSMRNYKSDHNNSFTMESLILAQDER